MLEGIVANLLNRFLGMYVQNFDPKQLNVGIWSGDVKLRNLELRREALDQLHLPINVVQGHLGLLTLTIPWSNLRGKPVHVNIEDVFLLAAPREDQDYDPEDERRRAHAVKMEKLDSAELLKERNTEGLSPEEQQKNQSFTASLTTAIVDNLQVSVKNVHIRYEDSISDPGHPFAAGLTLHELSAISTDSNWKPTFIQGSSTSSHKLATLGALALYWDTDTNLLGSGRGDDTAKDQGITSDQVLTKLKDMIPVNDAKPDSNHQYILKPVTGRAGLEIDKTGKTDRPKTKARLLFNELGFVVDDDQYRDVLMLVDLFHYFVRHQEYRMLQPKASPKEDPRAWLQFAAKAVLDKIHDRNKQWSWAYLKERRDNRLRYIKLFKMKKKDEKLSPEEADDMERLEQSASYEDLRFWRSLARNQLRKENVGVAKAPPKQTWSQWAFGGATKTRNDTHPDDSQMSEEQRKELYSAIDFDEKTQIAESVDAPRDAVKLQVDMGLREGSFTLKRDPHGKDTDILHLAFRGFDTRFLQRTDSMLLDLSLDTMDLIDGTTPDNKFRQALRVKDAKSSQARLHAPQKDRDADDVLKVEDVIDDNDDDDEMHQDDPFFALTFEKNPLKGHADTALSVKLKAMEYVYNPNFAVQIADFFKPPERQMESIGALMETAGATVEGLRQQTRAGLEFALQEHKTIDAQLDLQAPLIIIPDSVIAESNICMILDAGHISVRSDLIDKETMDRIQSRQKQRYTDEDFELLSELMYDKFDVRLESMQLLLGSTIDETRKQLADDTQSKTYHIVEKINMDFKVETCIVPKVAHLTKFRINGHLPVLHASLSDSKYKQFMRLLDIAIPKFSDEHVTQSASRPDKVRSKSFMDSEADRKKNARKLNKSDNEFVFDDDASIHNAEPQQSQPSINSQSLFSDKGDTSDQRNFEFRFTVDKLQGSLYRADPEDKRPDQLLVDLLAQGFYLEFYQTPSDMAAEVKLHKLAVEDHIEEGATAEFRNLISSDHPDQDLQDELFSLKFIKINKDSARLHTEHDGIAMQLDVAVSTINLMVTRKTLLTLLDFVLATFTSPQNAAPKAVTTANEDEPSANDAPAVHASTDEPAADKIRINARLKRIAVILNDDGIRLATLSLNSAEVALLLAGRAMNIRAKLGNLSLIDDINQGASPASSMRQLIAIQGDELADFRYQTFDPDAADYPGHDSMIYLRSGSIKVNFITEPFRKMMEFGIKFGKMQAIFNAARQAAANQANNISDHASKMRFDVLIRTPIVAFPRIIITDCPERDTLTAHLGEVYASNEFVSLDGQDGETANKLTAGLRNIRLTSRFNYADERSEELEILDKLDLEFKITSMVHRMSSKAPDMMIESTMSDVKLKITEAQLKFILELSRSIPEAFSTQPMEDIEGGIVEELPDATTKNAKAILESDDAPEDVKQEHQPTHQGPELNNISRSETKLDFSFKVGEVGLELVSGKLDQPIGDVVSSSLTTFALHQPSVKLRMVTDGSVESELLVRSFSITDTRTHEKNKFRKIMTLINTDVKQQFMASVSVSGGRERNLIALLTIDSPRVILALDYLFAVQKFVNIGLSQDAPLMVDNEVESSEAAVSEEAGGDDEVSVDGDSIARPEKPHDEAGMSMSYRVNVVDAQVVLIANPAITTSEAIVLGTKQILLSQQHAMTLQVDKVGMFLCRMDRFEDTKLRILDDFSIQTSVDLGSKVSGSNLTSISVEIEPLVLRLSLRDILVALQIFERASALSGVGDQDMAPEGPSKIKSVTAASVKHKSTVKSNAQSVTVRTGAKSLGTRKTTESGMQKPTIKEDSAVLSREEMTVQLDGIRIVLIGDAHELPILDWKVNAFSIDVKDWTGAMIADTSINTNLNVYNFSKSSWEPFMEPWQLGFHMSKTQHPDKLSLELYSRKAMELSITSATIALASKSAQFLSSDEDVLSKPRGSDSPFKIRNYTGFDVSIWAHAENGKTQTRKLNDGDMMPWRFEDPNKTRETLAPEGASGMIGINLEGSSFDFIERIPVSREGETLYNLSPKQNTIQHRLLVEVKLGADNVKYITIRSPMLVENCTQIPIEIGVFDPRQGHLVKIHQIPPGESRPSPVVDAYTHPLVIRPDQGFGYTWSDAKISWKDMLNRPSRTISCQNENTNQSPSFHFQIQSVFEKKDPIAASYPYQRIRVSAPIEVQNLLPVDLKYRIYDQTSKKDCINNFLRKGGVSPVHVVDLSHLLFMQVNLQDTTYSASEHAIINASDKEDYRREKTLILKDKEGQTLRLKLHYFNMPNSGGAFKVTIYSPYVVLNRTGLELDVRNKSTSFASTRSGGQNVIGIADEARKAAPFMFSYPTDDRKNRALLKVSGSTWGKPVSFDAIGSTIDVMMPAEAGRSEMHCGVTVEEGEGKYKLTKVVTVAPRFVIKNKLGEKLNVREPGSADVTTLEPGALLPLRFLKQTVGQQLCFCFPGVNNIWSSPFNIANVGSVHVKLAKSGERQKLIRVEILMEQATLFLHISIETKHWPFSMRNESDTEFLFWQANPNVDDEEDSRSSSWKPIRYRLPPKSIMPYAWDYPASKNRNLVLCANKKERYVKLAEIGTLIPFKVPPQPGMARQNIIDLNVVADGPTQTLVLSRWKPQTSLYKQKASSSNADFEIKERDSDVYLHAQIRFSGIGVSLINRQMRELVYITLRDIEVVYKDSKLYQMLTAQIKWIQVDNQLYGGIFPLIFYPSVVPKTGREMEAHPIFKAAITRVKDDSYGVLYIKYFTFLMQQMTIEIDEDFIFALLDFTKIPGAAWAEEREGQLCDDHLDIPEPEQEQSGQDIYFELLHLQPMQFDLSFVRTERINAEDTSSSSSNPFMFAINVLTMSIGNVNDAPIKYNALMLENARVSVGALVSNIQSHYVQESLRQVHIVLGSADFLGNPVGLFNNISSGVADIFYEPYQGLVMTDRPQDLGIGIAKGASSFVKKSVFGISDSMAKFTGSISKGLAAASMDKEFQDQRRMSRSRNRPKHALYGITSGGNAFASSMASGIGGLARHPLEGAEKEGALGFVKGVGKGVLGLATKPAIGAFDLASNMAEGVRNTTTVFDQEGLDRVRMPRLIDKDGIVRSYSQREALGQFWLKTLDNGKFFNEEYLAHLELAPGSRDSSSGSRQQSSSDSKMVILFYNGIVLLNAKTLKSQFDVPLIDIAQISKERMGISITLKGGQSGPFIPILDEQSRTWFYRQAATAVNAFNSRWSGRG